MPVSQPAWCALLRRMVLLLSLLTSVLVLAKPAWCAIAPPERTPLTLALLQQRLEAPVQLDGKLTLDLRHLVIDLRSEETEFGDQFYQQVRTRLQRSDTPLGIDLSFSQIQGTFEASRLGLRVPLYGEALSSTFTEAEQDQLRRDRRRLAQLSQLSRSLLLQRQSLNLTITVLRGPLRLDQARFEGVANFTNSFFLDALNAQGTCFAKTADFSDTRMSQSATFTGAEFREEARFRSTIFFKRASFSQVSFRDDVTFQGSTLKATANMSKATFAAIANFTRIAWEGNADFAQTEWQGLAKFDRSRFQQGLFFTDAVFAEPVTMRQVQFSQPVNLRGAAILSEADFGDAVFDSGAYLNVVGLQFNPDNAKLLGSPGEIGRAVSVPTLQGNETLLRNLIRNFRLLEQIADANQVDYLRQRLRLRELGRSLTGLNLNTASPAQLQRLGLSSPQIDALVAARVEQPLRNPGDLLKIDTFDLATYIDVRDRTVAIDSRRPFDRFGTAALWLQTAVLLLLTRSGTSTGLIFGVGLVAIAFYSILFWLLDRYRRRHPEPILPTLEEALWISGAAAAFVVVGLSIILRTSDYPGFTLLCLVIVAVPLPLGCTLWLYRQGRYHDLMETSYFVEDGSTRQLRILINKLPTIPRYPLFRERYNPLLWDRRWNWLNYIDVSLNNILRFGFNDLRLRDQAVPALITLIVWYQWVLGLLYVGLLLWTLSRTIPGLNLLIYFK
ncbi:MAG: pentapeptide repeat-containing protein [Kaiparowitsia implicata GSE-PSE-MK54-09C]|jgi:hypothetical protein|nr:pentapeptide repeat-containing protein [Kaiparowitsia implicata GSE-PSE-MK54-09C]